MKALFISEQTLLDNSVINENVSFTQIRPTIVKVQEMRIQPIVGSALYNEMVGQVVSGTTTALNTTLLDNSVINENVSFTQIRPTIVKVQEMRIQPIVGSALYNEMVTQVVSGTTTALNTTLLEDYIQPAMVQWLYYELPMVLAFKYMNKGMVRRTSEESSQMSMDEITRLTDKVKNDAEWYSERITRYLMEQKANYPLFNSPPSALDTIYPNGTNYNTGMALDARTLRRGAGLDRPWPYDPYCNNC